MTVLDYSARDYVGQTLHTADTLDRSSSSIRDDCDVVIVGAGPSGLASGTALAEAGLDVVIVEAGRFWQHESFKRRQSWAAEHLMQEQGTRIMTGNAFIPVASGRGVGGGTLVNSAICFRAPSWVLDEWVDDWGLDYFAENAREALFAEVEETIGVKATPADLAGENSHIARRGFQAMGFDHGYMPRNAPGCVGCGTCQTGCPVGGKATADLTWLPRFLRAGGRLYADTRAEQIAIAGDRALGIEAVMIDPDDDLGVADLSIRADRTIMAAGAMDTPQILQRQNLANSSGHVGENLHVHPTCGAIAKFPDENVRLWSGATQGYYAHHPKNRDILMETFSASPDVFLTQMTTVGESDPSQFLRDFKHLAACGLLIRDSSSGRVRAGKDGSTSIRYRLNRRDLQKLRAGLYAVVEMFHRAGSRAIRPMVENTRYFATHRAARQHIAGQNAPSDFSLYSSHPMGTCRAGGDPSRSVVRPADGQTYDVEGLHVVDSSLFPTAMGANPQVTIMAQALALGRRIAQL